jgi:septum formation topological specificity factor MinE
MDNKLSVTQERVLASLGEKTLYIEQLENNLTEIVQRYNQVMAENEMLKKEIETLKPAKTVN